MSDTDITHTILSRSKLNPWMGPLITPMIDCHSYDHAEQEFETEFTDRIILGIYEGDMSRQEAMDRYHEENQS